MIITVKDAISHLYKQANRAKYTPSAYWSTVREFSPSYTSPKFKEEFQKPKPKEVFKPFEIPQWSGDQESNLD